MEMKAMYITITIKVSEEMEKELNALNPHQKDRVIA
jgi:hypothetical protein